MARASSAAARVTPSRQNIELSAKPAKPMPTSARKVRRGMRPQGQPSCVASLMIAQNTAVGIRAASGEIYPVATQLTDRYKVVMVEEHVDEAGPGRVGIGGTRLLCEEVAAGTDFLLRRLAREDLFVGSNDEADFGSSRTGGEVDCQAAGQGAAAVL